MKGPAHGIHRPLRRSNFRCFDHREREAPRACPAPIWEVMMPAQLAAPPPKESLFAIDERLADLTDQAPGAAAEIGEVPRELLAEIDDCLEAFRTTVDRIAGRRLRRESIAAIRGKEVGRRPAARKKAAEGGSNDWRACCSRSFSRAARRGSKASKPRSAYRPTARRRS